MNAGGEFLVLDGLEPGTGTGTGTRYRLRLFEVQRRPRVFRDAVDRIPPDSGRASAGGSSTRSRRAPASADAAFMDIHIVNLREELPPYYRRLGYVESGTLPFSDPDRASRPCFFIVMTKPL